MLTGQRVAYTAWGYKTNKARGPPCGFKLLCLAMRKGSSTLPKSCLFSLRGQPPWHKLTSKISVEADRLQTEFKHVHDVQMSCRLPGQ